MTPITLAAQPAGFGIQLELDQQAAVAPATWDSVAGFARSIGAPSPQSAGGRTLTFLSWSDGGAAEHQITTPGAATTYTASFAIDCITVDDLILSGDSVDGIESREACVSITAGPAYEVVAGGELKLTAGESVALRDGFTVRQGGRLEVRIIPMI